MPKKDPKAGASEVIRENIYVTVRLAISRGPEVEVDEILEVVKCSLSGRQELKAALVDYEFYSSGVEVEPREPCQSEDEKDDA